MEFHGYDDLLYVQSSLDDQKNDELSEINNILSALSDYGEKHSKHKEQDIKDENDIYDVAERRGVIPARVLIECGIGDVTDTKFWPNPNQNEEGKIKRMNSDLFSNESSDALSSYVNSICESAQFARNTAYLHGLGCVAYAMNLNFRYSYYGTEKPVNLFVVTSQPPASGKSMVNSCLFDPVRSAYQEKARKNQKNRVPILKKIESLYAQIEKSDNDFEMAEISDDIEQLKQELELYPPCLPVKTNSTPEAMEAHAHKNGGKYALISDEANGINVLLGKTYGDAANLSNADIVLQGWDGDYMSVARVGREGFSGNVSGCISVIAQDETINTILESGMRGNGLSERFLMLKEPTRMGTRDRLNYTPINKNAKAQYVKLIENIINSDPTLLTFSDEAMSAILLSNSIDEPELSDSGKYSHPMLRGVIGKKDKQVMKLSSVLHGIKNWSQGSLRSTQIEHDTVIDAICIFEQLISSYLSVVDEKGFTGESSDIEKVSNYLARKRSKDKKIEARGWIDFRVVYKSLSQTKQFKNKPDFAKYLKDSLLVKAEDCGFCFIYENKIYINPKLEC